MTLQKREGNLQLNLRRVKEVCRGQEQMMTSMQRMVEGLIYLRTPLKPRNSKLAWKRHSHHTKNAMEAHFIGNLLVPGDGYSHFPSSIPGKIFFDPLPGELSLVFRSKTIPQRQRERGK